MRQLFIAFFMLFAATAQAESRDPASYFFQPKFGDFTHRMPSSAT